MKIKLCGVKRPKDIAYMNEFLPDYIGFVFAGTKRRVTPQEASQLAQRLNPSIRKVGIFVNETTDTIAGTVRLVGLDVVQLHGEEDEADISRIRELLPDTEIWKAVRVRSKTTVQKAIGLSADLLLLDSYCAGKSGGTGQEADYRLIQSCEIKRPYFLAGGLNCDNISRIIRELSPYGVDISSGIETDGVKDRRKIENLMRILRQHTKESGKVGLY